MESNTKNLEALWKETKLFINGQERRIVEKYIAFLREVAKAYIKSGKRVFFKENRIVHYGEGGFGWMIIESEDDPYNVFGDYIPEIRFESQISEKERKRGYKEITDKNIEDIKYEI